MADTLDKLLTTELARLQARASHLRALLSQGPRPGREEKPPGGIRRRTLSAAARKALSARMTAMWAAKRAAKQKAPASTKGRKGSK